MEAIGNIHSDGRPILGLDSQDLLELTLDTCPEAEFIPAHIWTPHFAMFGAFSGFDTMEECFGSLAPHIHAVETGLSSDPPMNWRVSALDGLTLVSHSDAHSPSKLCLLYTSSAVMARWGMSRLTLCSAWLVPYHRSSFSARMIGVCSCLLYTSRCV